jgi:immune inhibitor A
MMTLKRWIKLMLAGWLLAVSPAAAEPPGDFPTVTALEQAVVPVRDRLDLARRLLGVTDIPAPPAEPPQWAIGDRKVFFATNSAHNYNYEVEASLRIAGEHIYLWVQHDVAMDEAALQRLADIFDQEIYHPARALWGSENTPGIDGDPRIYGLFAYGMGPGVAAYFTSANSYPRVAVPNSNEHEMFYFNLDTLGTLASADTLAGLIAHEFQHMIREAQNMNEATWLDEGFSTFTEIYLGYPYGTLGQALTFLSSPGIQLNTWSEDGPRLPHYGAAMLFVTYFYERYGESALQMLSADPATGMDSVNNVLRALGEPDANAFFADWVLANYLHDRTLEDGRYAYTLIPGLSSALAVDIVTDYPYQRQSSVNQYATDYLILTNLDNPQALALELTMPETVRLVPVDAYSGQWMWYSNRRDESSTRLTRAFDLTGVETATLHYRVWYHIENLWDYGYVMVSTDDGHTWTVLETAHTTTENPHDNAYGPGYTGQSDGWLEEVIALDDFVGGQILLRFEMITDEAVVQPGMVIDDVGIPEIGYFSDFERDGGGWQAEGWLRTDNRLPQQAWVQAVQQRGDDAEISRWLVTGDTTWILPLIPAVEQVVLALSPFAPVTTVPMPYRLAIDTD